MAVWRDQFLTRWQTSKEVLALDLSRKLRVPLDVATQRLEQTLLEEGSELTADPIQLVGFVDTTSSVWRLVSAYSQRAAEAAFAGINPRRMSLVGTPHHRAETASVLFTFCLLGQRVLRLADYARQKSVEPKELSRWWSARVVLLGLPVNPPSAL